VLPPRFAELPAGPSQPELPGRGATTSYPGAPVAADGFDGAYAAGDHPGPGPDFRDDMPRAGRGFAAADPTASNGRGSQSSGSFPGRDTDLPYAGGPFAAPGRPFAGMSRAFNDPLTGPLRPAAASPAGGFGPFDEDIVTFPAGGIARYVPPDEHPESADPSVGGHGAGPTNAAPIGSPAAAIAGDRSEPPLSRRVPGASSPPSSLDLSSRFRTLDPDEARRLVEQFETGVARALGETATDRVDDEGLSR
jgi:hypothetical protein